MMCVVHIFIFDGTIASLHFDISYLGTVDIRRGLLGDST